MLSLFHLPPTATAAGNSPATGRPATSLTRLRTAGLATAFLGSALASAWSQEADPLEPGPRLDAVENLGENLRVSEAVTADGGSVAEAVGGAISAGDGGDAGRRGRWRFAPHLEVTGTFDDNIFIKHRDEVADFIFTLAPGVALGFWDEEEERERYLSRQHGAATVPRGNGNFLMVDYTAILLGFARTSSQNALDHDGYFAGQWKLEKLTLGASIHGESKSEANADVGGRVQRKTVRTEVRAGYQLSDKTALEVALFNTYNDPEDFTRTVEWRGEAYLAYAPTPLLKFGLGAGAGLVDVDGGAERTFERLLVGGSYALTEKFEVRARVGVEFRQSDGPSGDEESPIFEAEATWTPAENTRVRLEGFRRVETSAFRPDDDILRTGGVLSVQRELRGGLHFTIEGGYAVAEYTGAGSGGDRTDRYYFVSPGLLYNFARWGNIRAAYTHRSNDSNRSTSSFDNNQVTLQISLIF